MKYAIIIGLLAFTACSAGADEIETDIEELSINNYDHIDAANAQVFIDKYPEAVILDVRTPAEFKEAHIKNAINVDYHASDFRRQLNKLDKSTHYIIHCKSGFRSSKSLDIMKRLGFERVTHIDGGFDAWKAAGLSSES